MFTLLTAATAAVVSTTPPIGGLLLAAIGLKALSDAAEISRDAREHDSEIVEAYIKRLNDLEQLAMSYPGVTKTYAIQAGRELRVIVGADKIDDKQTENLSGEIAKKIQDEMTYPGQVKITVIRETRAVSYAK